MLFSTINRYPGIISSYSSVTRGGSLEEWVVLVIPGFWCSSIFLSEMCDGYVVWVGKKVWVLSSKMIALCVDRVVVGRICHVLINSVLMSSLIAIIRILWLWGIMLVSCELYKHGWSGDRVGMKSSRSRLIQKEHIAYIWYGPWWDWTHCGGGWSRFGGNVL